MIGGPGAKLADVLKQKPTKPCLRCGLHYEQEDHNQCPHCSSLNDSELAKLQQTMQAEKRGNHYLGMKFLAISLVLGVFLLFLISQ